MASAPARRLCVASSLIVSAVFASPAFALHPCLEVATVRVDAEWPAYERSGLEQYQAFQKRVGAIAQRFENSDPAFVRDVLAAIYDANRPSAEEILATWDKRPKGELGKAVEAALGIDDAFIAELRQAVQKGETARVKELVFQAQERYNLEFLYMAFSDHGPGHYMDLRNSLAGLREMALAGKTLPEPYARYTELVRDGTWYHLVLSAVLLHDGQMIHGRLKHAELAFVQAAKTFADLPIEAQAIIGALTLMHSNSTSALSYDQLGNWLSIVRDITKHDTRMDAEILDSPAGKALRDALAAFEKDPDTQAKVIDATKLIRLVDAKRPLGNDSEAHPGVRNTLGWAFRIVDGEVFLERRRASGTDLIPIPQGQFRYAFGNIAVDNPIFRDGGQIDFPMYWGWDQPAIKNPLEAALADPQLIRSSLGGTFSDFLTATVEKSGLQGRERDRLHAILFTIGELLSDYPPEILTPGGKPLRVGLVRAP